MIKPIFTEKSLSEAKKGRFSFWVDRLSNKNSLKAAIAEIFGVDVIDIKTSVTGGESGKNARGRKFTDMKKKKATVMLKKGQKIDIFEPVKK